MDFRQSKWPIELARCEIELGVEIGEQFETQVRRFDSD